MHAKRNCGAAAFRVVVISFSLLLCDVGGFFVTQSHSIKVSRWSALVIFFFFSFFLNFCRSSTVIVFDSSSRAHLLRSLAMLIQVLLVWVAAFDWVFSFFKFFFEEFVDVIFPSFSWSSNRSVGPVY